MRVSLRWKQLVVAMGFAFVFLLPMQVAMAPGAEAGIVPCGASADDPSTVDANEAAPCTLCHLVIGVKRLIDWGLQIMTFFAVAVITAMGVLYILSAGDQGMIKTAKDGLKASLYGFALMLLVWLLVAVVLATFAKDISNFKAGAKWYEFTCDTGSNVGTSTMPIGSNIPVASPAGPGTTFAGNGRCAPVTSAANPCAASNMQGTCMSAHADTWSAICQGESSGNRTLGSGVDKCADGNSASWGLFQINITVNKVGGLDCPSAFSGGGYTAHNHNCRVSNKDLFDRCVQAAQDPKLNIQAACQLSKNGANTGPWGAARGCGFPRSL